MKTILFVCALLLGSSFAQFVYPNDLQRKVDSLTDAVQRLEKAQEADRDRASEVGNSATTNVIVGMGAVLLVITFLGFINYRASKSDFDSFAVKAEANLKQITNSEIDDVRKQYHDHLKFLREQTDSITPTLKKAIDTFEIKISEMKEVFDRHIKDSDTELFKKYELKLSEIEAHIQIRVWTELVLSDKIRTG
jgi:DNA anti-recombination protein RmuC